MATVVPFKPSRGPSRATLGQRNSQCEVLLFTGVRYERWVEPPAASASELRSSTKPRRAKRTLELAD